MVFRNATGKTITREEILKKRKEEGVVSIKTKSGLVCRIRKNDTVVYTCERIYKGTLCALPIMNYSEPVKNGEKVLRLSCPYCSARKIIKDKELIKSLLNREEENKETQPPLFNEAMVQ